MVRRADQRYEIHGHSGIVGDIVKSGRAWVFFPSVYRWAIDLKTAGEILTLLEELNT